MPATEMSCVHGRIDDMHMLGYWVDTTAIAPACRRAQRERITRAEEIVERLNAQGVPVRFEDAIAEAGNASSVGRPHIARAAGVKPEEMNAFFEEWLVPGAKAFVARRWPDAAEATELIHEAGGAAVLAHPFWDMSEPKEVAALIADLDLDGVECFYPAHDRAQTKFLLEVCRERGLAATASSDFHGPSHKMFDSFCAYPTYDLGEPELPPPHQRVAPLPLNGSRLAARPRVCGAPSHMARPAAPPGSTAAPRAARGSPRPTPPPTGARCRA